MNAHPLSWPDGWPRTHAVDRLNAKFSKSERRYSGDHSYKTKRDLTVADSVRRLTEAVRSFTKVGRNWRIDPDDVIISTNLLTRLDGLPRSGQRAPTDPGVSVYWKEHGGQPRVIAIDQYTTVADNIAAIAATLEAMRAIERHGGARIMDRAFTGFTALPAPGAARGWRDILGFADGSRPTRDEIVERKRKLASIHHPDKGGDHAAMAEINMAFEQGCAEI